MEAVDAVPRRASGRRSTVGWRRRTCHSWSLLPGRRAKGMAAAAAYAKRILLACNGGGDAVSLGVTVGLARHGCRLVLVGDEGALATTAEEAWRSAAEGAAAVAVVGLDIAACDEASVGAAVRAAWHCFGGVGLDALVNCCSYEDPALGFPGKVEKVEQLKKELPNVHVLDQFSNPANPEAHIQWTGTVSKLL